MRELILNKDYAGIRKAISANPKLASEGIMLEGETTNKAHPLHRICDFVFSKKLTDEEAVKIAQIYLEFGADVNGYPLVIMKDTPLLAASSLHADLVAVLYINHQANIHHQGCHGGTALHWASWCGRDMLVKRLISEVAIIDKRCIDFQSTPLFWAVKSYEESADKLHQLECIKLLIHAGADKDIPNAWGDTIYSMIKAEDLELKKILSN